MRPSAPPVCAASVVVSTYNRASHLPDLLKPLLVQDIDNDDLDYEVIVVDNNSSDGTLAVLQRLAAVHPRLRYAREERQGVSYGRNHGVALARAPVIAFTDDDVRVGSDWVRTVLRLFDEHPDSDFVGGKVLPAWQSPPPQWITRLHWGPLALLDYGEQLFRIDASHRLCLLTANFAVRRTALDAVGLFSGEFPRCQDHELLLRFWRAGHHGLYAPDLVVTAVVPPDRLTRRYHRMWHERTAGYYALMPPAELFGMPSLGQPGGPVSLFGVPAFTYRELVSEAAAYLRTRFTRQEPVRLHHELRVRHLARYVSRRYRLHRRRGSRSRLVEIGGFLRELGRQKRWVDL